VIDNRVLEYLNFDSSKKISSLHPGIMTVSPPFKRVDHGETPADQLLEPPDQHRVLDNPPLCMLNGAVIAPRVQYVRLRDVPVSKQEHHVSCVIVLTSVATSGLTNSMVS
jgi:hypothetical protein